MAGTTLTDAEIALLRQHLGYGAIKVAAYPYTPDGFYEVFKSVVQPNLDTQAESTSGTPVPVAGIVTITPASMVGIAPQVRLACDVADDHEVVVVRSVTATTFDARFTKAHSGIGWPVNVESAITRLRALFHSANQAFDKLKSPTITASAGIKQLGKGQIEWFGGGTVLSESAQHYLSIVDQIAQICRVPNYWREADGHSQSANLEAH